MTFLRDDRAVSPVIGAILLFGIAVALLATIQTTGIPAQNQEVEFNHYVDSQQDLQEMRTAIVDAPAAGEVDSVTMDLGAQYPSHLLFFNRPPASGRLATETVGSGEIRVDAGGVNLTNVCGLGSTGSVGTKHLTYAPNYNYLDGGGEQRYENSVLYQPTGSGEPVIRGRQTFVRPETRTIALSPLRGNLSESSSRSVSVEFFGGQTGERTYADPTLDVPSRLSAAQWNDMVDSANVTITADGTDTVEFDFAGTWTVRCTPVGINRPPAQVTSPYSESADDSPGFINPRGPNEVGITEMDTVGQIITAEFTNNATASRTMTGARLAYVSGGGTLSSSAEAVMSFDGHTSMPALEGFRELNTKPTIAPGATEDITFTIENIDLSSWLGTNDYYAVVQVRYANGDVESYMVGTSDLL